MELILPLLGFACFYLIGLVADLYLLVQLVMLISKKVEHRLWSTVWLVGNAIFLLGLLLHAGHPQAFPISPQMLLSEACIFSSPFFWLFAFYKFKRASFNKSSDNIKVDLETEYIIDIRNSNDIWPPPPTRPGK